MYYVDKAYFMLLGLSISLIITRLSSNMNVSNDMKNLKIGTLNEKSVHPV